MSNIFNEQIDPLLTRNNLREELRQRENVRFIDVEEYRRLITSRLQVVVLDNRDTKLAGVRGLVVLNEVDIKFDGPRALEGDHVKETCYVETEKF